MDLSCSHRHAALVAPALGVFGAQQLVALALILAAAFATPDVIGRPVYGLSTDNFALVFQATYLPVVLRTFVYATVATLVCLAIGYPCAYAIACF